jgi:hypothetical protein
MSGLQNYIDICVKREIIRHPVIDVRALAAAIQIAYRSRSLNEITRRVLMTVVSEGGSPFHHQDLTELNMAALVKAYAHLAPVDPAIYRQPYKRLPKRPLDHVKRRPRHYGRTHASAEPSI